MKVPVGERLCADDSLFAIEDQLRQRWDTVVKSSNETSGCQSNERPTDIRWLRRGRLQSDQPASTHRVSCVCTWHLDSHDDEGAKTRAEQT